MKERKIIVKIYRKCLMKFKKYKIIIFLDRLGQLWQVGNYVVLKIQLVRIFFLGIGFVYRYRIFF